MQFCMRARGCLALGKLLISIKFLWLCVQTMASPPQQTHTYLVWRGSVLLKIISALIFGVWPVDLLHAWSCKIQGEYCPCAFLSDKSRVMFCSLGEGWDHGYGYGYGRPWAKQDPHSEIICQGFCYLVTDSVATSYKACSDSMQMI